MKPGEILLQLFTCGIVIALGCIAFRLGSKIYFYLGADRWLPWLTRDTFTGVSLFLIVSLLLLALPIIIYDAIADRSFRRKAAELAKQQDGEVERD